MCVCVCVCVCVILAGISRVVAILSFRKRYEKKSEWSLVKDCVCCFAGDSTKQNNNCEALFTAKHTNILVK